MWKIKKFKVKFMSEVTKKSSESAYNSVNVKFFEDLSFFHKYKFNSSALCKQTHFLLRK